ncbi:ABC transporter ATP-binding protein [Sunxiuqinia dokdonensis]|uniref:ATP-binding protein n=1 Tax=Sunxiuqinia dokdonensis TaxID=1409788 RepID=A0A0L8V3Q9_9BACT|nr:ABC transporter ATP-binding protein [Sunxiuqinia dokdonensis]KOH43066.1 ATP-binding protein [Sunxiuqinia dokdonensis]
MLEIKTLTKSFQSGSGARRVILDELSLSVQDGESVAIVGPSGSGKTTLLNMLGALDRPDRGDVLLNGESVFSKNEKQLAEFRNRSIGFVFQLHHLLPQLNLMENILLPVVAQQSAVDAASRERAEKLTRKLGITGLQNQRPGQLSGGECQRTAVARALINQPRILLADEPTGALDQQSSTQLADLLLQLNREENTSLIVVTHSMALASKMDKIYQLENGKLQLTEA